MSFILAGDSDESVWKVIQDYQEKINSHSCLSWIKKILFM